MNTVLQKVLGFIGDAVAPTKNNTHPVIKQFKDEQMEAIEWLYPVEQDDLHDERMDRDEIRNMVTSLNKALTDKKLATAVDHTITVEGCHLVKAWVNECDCYIGETFVPEGWPLAKMKFTNKELWKMRKEGKLMGLSIGARCSGREEVEE